MGALPTFIPADGLGKVVVDAWDFKGRPATRTKTGGWISATMILGMELCERLTTLGIAVNLVKYLRGTMHLGNAEAANVVTNFMGSSFLLCLLGGFIADTFLGRYLTITIFAIVQASGVMLLTASTKAPSLHPPPCTTTSSASCGRATGRQLGVLYLGLFLTALGTGGVKSSVSGLGSDQFDESDPTEKKQMLKFFNWFFFFVSVGSLFAVTVLVYIQDNLGQAWGYGACATTILVCLAVFLAGTGRYRFKKLASGSPLTQIAAVAVAAWRKRCLELPADPSMLYDADYHTQELLPHTKQLRFLDRAAIKVDFAGKYSKWRQSTVTEVEEVKTVIRMLPIWATTILFWTVYAQMMTFSVSQAGLMDRHVSNSFRIPPGSLAAFFVVAILLTVPLYDFVFLPIYRYLKITKQKGLTPLQRIGVGLVLSTISMVAAAVIERQRLAAQPETITVFWLVPQYVLVGSGVAFTYVGQLHFFLRESPTKMKSMSTGLFLSTLALGFFLSSALVAIVHKITGKSGRGAWLADDLNRGQLYKFYWLLAVLCLVNFVLYVVPARWYAYRVVEDEVDEDEDDGGNY